MKLVIEMDEKLYGRIFHSDAIYDDDKESVVKAITSGTPLPKGHGRLIDVNDLLDDINLEDNDYNRDVNTGEIITLENIDRIPTIIEAEVQDE